ncbi:integrase domain-containing protein [Alteromonas sp. W364]|uniref:integrase domain-containing protein n=1 Tax=Alteromonas sp. W364 TaxID=3075610 RepID=UPI002888A0FF|nr:integrase domain-containing protein [Alteromonas sp. W364]MDT0626891.1 integrase domain-containing protein [Alteromonas sp. W364]
MPKQVLPLTKTQLEKLAPKEKEFKISDGGGLFIRVKPTGTMDWRFIYTNPITKKRQSMSFGVYPTVSLTRARNKRDEARELISDNIDPKAHKEEKQRQTLDDKLTTFKSVMDDWIIVKGSKVSSDHATDIKRSLEIHVLPDLADRPIKEITNREVIEILKPLAAKGSLEMVKRVCQRINEVMTFAVNTGLLEHNSFAGIRHAFDNPKPQNLPTIEITKLPDLLSDINRASIKTITRCLIEWQLHTMVRPSEAAGARWDEIDFDKEIWVIPEHRMKRGENGEHRVPLTPQTLSLLGYLKPISGHREFLFPADRNPKNHTHPSTANMALKRMGYHKKLVAHGLRSIASTTLNEQGFDPEIIETCLSHLDSNTVRRAYNRGDYLERRRKIMAWWSQHIEDAARGSIMISTSSKTLRIVNN